MKARTLLAMLALVVSPWIVNSTSAQVQRVDIGVDGLACPFCSYGLEKKLKEVKGVGEVEINISKGVAVIKSKGSQSIEVEHIEPVVKDAGFTLRDLSASVAGVVKTIDGSPTLVVSDSNTSFVLAANNASKSLRSNQKVTVTGTLSRQQPKGHTAHPFTLTIQEIEVQ